MTNTPEARIQYAETRLEPIWDSLVSILKDPQNVIPRLEAYTFKSTDAKKAQIKIAELETQIKSVLAQRARVVRVYTDGGIEESEYETQMKDAASRLVEIRNEKSKFEQVLIKKDESKGRGEIIANLYKKIEVKLESADYETRKYILNLFIERINLYHKENFAEVIFRFPSNTKVRSTPRAEQHSSSNIKLTLRIKTLSIKDRQTDILKSNPRMYRRK